MEDQMRSADQMVRMVMQDPARLAALKTDPLPELEKLRADAVKATPPAYMGDKVLYRMALFVLGSLALIAAVGSVVLVYGGKTTPEALVALGSAAVGALVGLFAPSPMTK
jgi:hypothetical protein